MGTRLSESAQYRHLWGTTELSQVFEEPARLQRWLDILTALATAQARLGLIPAEAASEIAAAARADRLDLDLVAAETRRTSHSMLGLIRGLQLIQSCVGTSELRSSTRGRRSRTSPTPGSR